MSPGYEMRGGKRIEVGTTVTSSPFPQRYGRAHSCCLPSPLAQARAHTIPLVL